MAIKGSMTLMLFTLIARKAYDSKVVALLARKRAMMAMLFIFMARKDYDGDGCLPC